MLKLIYTETGLVFEFVNQSEQDWLALRIQFAESIGQTLIVESSYASFLLPTDTPGIQQLETLLEVSLGDAEMVEISLEGIWLSTDPDGIEGIFATSLDDATELLLIQLWQDSYACSMA